MAAPNDGVHRRLNENTVLRTILEGTATETGEAFFAALVRNLCEALNSAGAWVTVYDVDARRLQALAFWFNGALVPDYEYDISGTPCEAVVDQSRLVHIPEEVISLFPADPDLPNLGAVSYMGVPLEDSDGTVLGHLAVLDTRPMPDEPQLMTVVRIFAARAAAELRRLRAEAEVRVREEKLTGLVDGALDAIIEFDRDLTLTRLNPAAEKLFACTALKIIGTDFGRRLAPESRDKLERLLRELEDRPEGGRHLWIPGGLDAIDLKGDPFPAEASLALFEVRGRPFVTLILRNVNERLESERKIRSLAAETEYLKEELSSLRNVDEIIGHSEPLLNVLRDVGQVAATDATVLILGETGTGKELIARAIHGASDRRDRPLIKVNCAAIPVSLMESEFFGHEKGAFTGATTRREGRFALADGGTIFLDEIGELSLDLQAKLLRVLQDGEFEPVGSSKTRKVDVRVIAATNRELAEVVEDGGFRQDLYYRIAVFPIRVPPLRERGDDIVLLAEAFVRRFAQRSGRTIEPVGPAEIRRLRSYSWPGNVRELENVIERAVITSTDGTLNLERALPETADTSLRQAEPAGQDAPPPIRTVDQLKQLERQNILLALEAAGWKVAGKDGAAHLLGMKPSTLSSRMKALQIRRPGRA